ncbi:hypothetical protein BLA29_011312, partial [Euroglyphus maynei]
MSKRDKIIPDLCDATMMCHNNGDDNEQQRKLFRNADSRTATIHARKKPGFSQVLMTTQNHNNHRQQQQPTESETDRM